MTLQERCNKIELEAAALKAEVNHLTNDLPSMKEEIKVIGKQLSSVITAQLEHKEMHKNEVGTKQHKSSLVGNLVGGLFSGLFVTILLLILKSKGIEL